MKLSSLIQASTEEIENLDHSTRGFLLKVFEVSPYEAYLVLKDSFGKPNIDNKDEYKIQWQYYLKNNNNFIEIYDWKLGSWSIAVYCEDTNKETGQTLAESLYNQIKHESSRFKSKIKSSQANPKRHIIQNPFLLYYQTADELLQMAKTILNSASCARKDNIPIYPTSEASPYFLCRSAFFLYIAAFEGFLNLIYELYLKKELRDERIYERLAREQIDIKLRLAPIYCECFQDTPIDHTTGEFKRLHSIINLRNDFIHANLTRSMRTSVINDDGYNFLVPSTDNDLHGVPRSFSDLDIEHIETIKQIIDNMIQKLLEYMKPRFRKEFEDAKQQDYIDVEYEDGVMVIIR